MRRDNEGGEGKAVKEEDRSNGIDGEASVKGNQEERKRRREGR